MPNSVPIPYIEALLNIVRMAPDEPPKSLKPSDVRESLATVVPTAKLLILSAFTIRNQ